MWSLGVQRRSLSIGAEQLQLRNMTPQQVDNLSRNATRRVKSSGQEFGPQQAVVEFRNGFGGEFSSELGASLPWDVA